MTPTTCGVRPSQAIHPNTQPIRLTTGRLGGTHRAGTGRLGRSPRPAFPSGSVGAVEKALQNSDKTRNKKPILAPIFTEFRLLPKTANIYSQGPSLSRTQTLIATRVPCGGWREQQGSGRPFTRTRNQKRLNNGRLGGNTPRPAAFPSEGHGARKCLPSDPCTVHSHPGKGEKKTRNQEESFRTYSAGFIKIGGGHRISSEGNASDPCSVRSRQSPHHASVRKGSHQIHILEGGKFRQKHATRTSSAGFHQNFKVDF